jgi:hypothetical protein
MHRANVHAPEQVRVFNSIETHKQHLHSKAWTEADRQGASPSPHLHLLRSSSGLQACSLQRQRQKQKRAIFLQKQKAK